MAQILQFGNHRISNAEVFPMLAGYQMLPQLCRYLIIDRAIAPIELTTEEKTSAIGVKVAKSEFAATQRLKILPRLGFRKKIKETQHQFVIARSYPVEKCRKG